MTAGPQSTPVPAALAARRRPVVVCFRPGIARPLAQSGLDCEVVQWRPGEAPPAGHRADVCLGGNLVDDSALAWAEGATWVHLTGVGHDNVPCGLPAGRVVTNSPGANAAQVAEFAFAGVLAAAKQLPETWEADPPGGRGTGGRRPPRLKPGPGHRSSSRPARLPARRHSSSRAKKATGPPP